MNAPMRIRADLGATGARGSSPAARHSLAAFSHAGGSAVRARGFSPAARHSLAAFSHAGGGAAKARGFTLIEIVLATVLLAMGLTIAFASLHSANASVQRSEDAAARNEHLRAVQSLLYRFLQSAQPLVLARDESTQQVTYLDGKSGSVRFVAAMPGYMSRGGPYVVTLQLVPSVTGHGTSLQFVYAMLVDEKPLESDSKRPPEALLDGIADGHFEYRGLAQDGQISDWHTAWTRNSQLPMQIRLVLRFTDPARPWPPFMTALPLGFAQARADDAVNGVPAAPVPVQVQGGGQ